MISSRLLLGGDAQLWNRRKLGLDENLPAAITAEEFTTRRDDRLASAESARALPPGVAAR
jgi:hypothetical protein